MSAPDSQYPLAAIFLMGAATFGCRLFPFLVPRRIQDNRHLRFIGDALPAAVMVVLVAYCLKDVRMTTPPYGAPEFLSITAVVAIHLWRRNALLSIGLGTALYLFLVRSVFA